MSITLRHKSASGRLDNAWEYDQRTQRVHAVIAAGAIKSSIDVEVCSPERPRIGAHPIKRLNGETWRIEAHRYVREWKNGVERVVAFPCPIGDAIGPGTSLTLTQAPPIVDDQLEAL